ncbi:LysR substrate-binding domain-containing protein [Palleronia caenipelagi]|uniref:LysR family transcriptional regulator n=1 Tax=Palleronia caenipelagi TaxID=2489174 RepID=A0A547PXU2_9RHOB|nr:LysR substrate-binding domain-containing protein [Palleronia caenipelagi]TRD18934.1 LysR family transcriptional regulator [Palleronia caenipelagi]
MSEPVRLRQLEALNALSTSGSVTKAAEQLGVSQPAVSRLLSDLSRDFGFPLYQRRDGRIHLTQEANFLLPEIRRVLDSMAYITEAGRNLTQRKAGHLRIACLPGFATSHLPRVVSGFLENRPGVTLTIEPDRPERILEWIIGQQYDCGITDGFDEHPAIESQSVELRTVCVFPTGHRLAAKSTIGPEDLQNESIIHPRRDSDFSRALNDIFVSQGVTMQSVIEIRQFTGACELVRQGTGVAVVSELDATSYLDRGLDFRPFEPAVPHRLSILRPIHRQTSLLTLEFISAFAESLKPYHH